MAAILDVFTGVATWFASVFDIILPIFYTPGVGEAAGQLTFIGNVSVMSLGLGIILLILRRVVDFLQFRG